jgi:hypothetical protein
VARVKELVSYKIIFLTTFVIVQVKLSLCLTKHYAMKTYGGMLQVFLTLALVGGERSASRP